MSAIRISLSQLALLLTLSLAHHTALAWDATGHRLTAYVAWELMTLRQREAVSELLQTHPRFEPDFHDAMPDFIRRSDEAEQQRWLFGQAAFWPDLARGFPPTLRRQYHRPNWHWIDGRWTRGEAVEQGEIYLNTNPLPAITGRSGATIAQEAQVDNVVVAFEFSLQQLRDESLPPAQRALALSWVLHLLGDLHQPLHTGALRSENRFSEGDRGGNAIPVRGGSNLHAVWDRALRDLPFQDNLETVISLARQLRTTEGREISDPAPERWLRESREFLHDAVYSPGIRNAILVADRESGSLPPVALDDEYIEQMREIARERIALSGLRIAALFAPPLNF